MARAHSSLRIVPISGMSMPIVGRKGSVPSGPLRGPRSGGREVNCTLAARKFPPESRSGDLADALLTRTQQRFAGTVPIRLEDAATPTQAQSQLFNLRLREMAWIALIGSHSLLRHWGQFEEQQFEFGTVSSKRQKVRGNPDFPPRTLIAGSPSWNDPAQGRASQHRNDQRCQKQYDRRDSGHPKRRRETRSSKTDP